MILMQNFEINKGGVAEWLKAHAWKACIQETVSWVRIPSPPPFFLKVIYIDIYYENTFCS